MPTVFPEAVELPNGPLRVSQLALLQEGYAAGRASVAAAAGTAAGRDHPLAFTDLLFAVVLPIALMAIFWYFKPKESQRMGDDDAIELEEGFLLVDGRPGPLPQASPLALELPRVPLEAASAVSPASLASSESPASPASPAVPALALQAEVQEGTPGTLIIGDDLEGQVDWAPSAGDPPARGLLVQAPPRRLYLSTEAWRSFTFFSRHYESRVQRAVRGGAVGNSIV
ncbi:unnamed protein product [Symbiodinium natans]|uniref:Uncharacterized protein n=1 Tax=Symbiodinium natans TaxID=878477 RepID=A0A812QEN3_9DINO|nr:unnamed protein product [Symbiodinium natans]